MSITEKQLSDIEMCDEYNLRHFHDEIIELSASYRNLVGLLEDAGVLQLQDDWAIGIQEFIGDVQAEEP